MDISNFELKSIRVFCAIFQTKNISEAALQLNISTSSVNRILKQLRDQFDDHLFKKNGRKMLPTEKAKQISHYFLEVLQQLSYVIESDFRPLEESFDLRIGLNDLTAELYSGNIVRNFSKNAPNVSVSFHNASYINAVDALDHDEIDLAIVPHFQKASHISQERLFDVNYVILARKNHPKLSNSSSPLDMDTYCHLDHALVTYKNSRTGWVDEVLKENNCERRIKLRLPFFNTLPNLIANCDLVTTVPKAFAEQAKKHYALECFELPFESRKLTFYITWLKTNNNNPVNKWSRETIKKIVES